MTLSDFVTEEELADVRDGVKDFLKETYKISDQEADAIISGSLPKADEYLNDYFPYVHYMSEIRHLLRETLDAHFQEVDREREPASRMRSDAAVWLTFECVRRLYQRSVRSL